MEKQTFNRDTVSFGMKTVIVGNVHVYTAKIRIAGEFKFSPAYPELVVETYNVPSRTVNSRKCKEGTYTTVCFSTTCQWRAEQMFQYIGSICKQRAIAKLREHYAWVQ